MFIKVQHFLGARKPALITSSIKIKVMMLGSNFHKRNMVGVSGSNRADGLR